MMEEEKMNSFCHLPRKRSMQLINDLQEQNITCFHTPTNKVVLMKVEESLDSWIFILEFADIDKCRIISKFCL